MLGSSASLSDEVPTTYMDSKVVVGIIAATSSVIAALLSFSGVLFTSWYARQSQIRLEAVKALLEQNKADKNALRDYQYEARRRLYRECEPAIFRLVEECESAHDRILSFAQLCRSGKPTAVEDWINSGDNQFSTLYRLIAPLAAFKVLSEKLTLFDLSLDHRIYVQYMLAKTMVEAYQNDLLLAAASNVSIEYCPDCQPPEEEFASPSIYTLQGVSHEHMDIILAEFIESSATGRQVISYPTFARRRTSTEDPMHIAVLNLDYLLRDFSPLSRPVLWRIMLAQAVLCSAVTRSYNSSVQVCQLPSLASLTDKDRQSLSSNVDPSIENGAGHIDSALAFLSPRLQRAHEMFAITLEAQ